MGELLHCRHVPHDGAGELTEGQPDRLVEDAVGIERRDRDPDVLLVGGDVIPGGVVERRPASGTVVPVTTAAHQRVVPTK